MLRDQGGVLPSMSRHVRLLGIDGFCGSGKSRLAESISQTKGYLEFETDKYVKVKGGDVYYADRLDLEKLKSELTDRLGSNKHICCVVHGICLRDILERLGMKADMHIYIKRVSQPTIDETLWHEGIDLDQLECGEVSLEQWDEPDKSAFRYHLQWHPERTADLLYERVEGVKALPCNVHESD